MQVTENRKEGLLDRQHLLELLRGHHRQIGAVLGDAEAALSSLDPARSTALALLRWQLMRMLRSYQVFKHIELFDPICRGDDVVKARIASVMKTRCLSTGEAYEAHVKKWSAGGIESAWALYENESRAMIASIRQHLARESTESECLLSGSTSLRPSSTKEA